MRIVRYDLKSGIVSGYQDIPTNMVEKIDNEFIERYRRKGIGLAFIIDKGQALKNAKVKNGVVIYDNG